MQIYELSARFDARASFYGKARVLENRGRKVLQSYNTDVCEIDENGVFHRYWSGYSPTTMRHINEFLRQNDVAGGGAAWWRAQPVEAFGWPEFFAGALA